MLLIDTVERFLRAIQYDEINHIKGTEAARDVLPEDADRIKEILSSTPVRTWFYAPRSRVLYSEGGGEKAESGRPMASVFGQKFIAQMQDGRVQDLDGIALYWICEAHPHKDAYDACVDLAGQLLSSSKEALPIPELRPKKEPRPGGDMLTMVTDVAKTIEAQLQYTNVYCVVDSIDTYQDRARESSTSDLLQYLGHLAARARAPDWANHNFKLMWTCAGCAPARDTWKDHCEALELIPKRIPKVGDWHLPFWILPKHGVLEYIHPRPA